MDPISQTQTTTITATSKSAYNPTVTPEVVAASFDTSFLDPCADATIVTLTDPGQTSPATFNYDGSTKGFTYNEFTVFPAWCEATIVCVDVVGPTPYLTCADHDISTLAPSTDWTFDRVYYAFGLLPGTYTYNYDVVVGDVTETFTVDLVLIDPCLTATITVPAETTERYYITDPNLQINFAPVFAVDPDFCKTDISGPTANPTDPNIPTTLCVDGTCINVPPIIDSTDPSNPNGNPA